MTPPPGDPKACLHLKAGKGVLPKLTFDNTPRVSATVEVFDTPLSPPLSKWSAHSPSASPEPQLKASGVLIEPSAPPPRAGFAAPPSRRMLSTMLSPRLLS